MSIIIPRADRILHISLIVASRWRLVARALRARTIATARRQTDRLASQREFLNLSIGPLGGYLHRRAHVAHDRRRGGGAAERFSEDRDDHVAHAQPRTLRRPVSF